MSHPDLKVLIPAVALAACAGGEPLPPQPIPIPPSAVIIEQTSTFTQTLWTFHGELLSPPLDGKGATTSTAAQLTCAVTDQEGKKGVESKVFEACGISGHIPPIVPLTRKEYCDQVNRGAARTGQLNLRLNTGEINIFTTPSDMVTTLEPYSRCGEFRGLKAQAPRRTIYERPVRGRFSRRKYE